MTASPVFTLANQLTLLRMLLIPAFVLLVVYGRFGWALTVFVIAGITDALDGLIARWTGQKSELGAWLDPAADKLLLVTAGSGITPVIGMLRNLFSRSRPVATDIVMIHVNPTESAALFREELRRLGATGRIRLIERYDDRDGLLEVAMIDELVPDLTERLSYACGPAGLLDALEEHHNARGLALTTERWPRASSSTVQFRAGLACRSRSALPTIGSFTPASQLPCATGSRCMYSRRISTNINSVSRPRIAAFPGRAARASLIVNFSVVSSQVPDPGGTTVGRLPRASMASIDEYSLRLRTSSIVGIASTRGPKRWSQFK